MQCCLVKCSAVQFCLVHIREYHPYLAPAKHTSYSTAHYTMFTKPFSNEIKVQVKSWISTLWHWHSAWNYNGKLCKGCKAMHTFPFSALLWCIAWRSGACSWEHAPVMGLLHQPLNLGNEQSLGLYVLLHDWQNSAVQCSVVQCSAMHWTAVSCSTVQCTTLHCTVLYCNILHCSALQCTGVE